MKKEISLRTLLLVVIIVIIGACAQESKDTKVENEILKPDETVQKKDTQEEIFYRVPTPDELYALIKEGNLRYDPEIMNPVTNLASYSDKVSRSINLGVYTADLAYAAAFEDYKKAIEYFDIVYEMSDEIGFSSVFTEDFLDRIKNNLNEVDSLISITNETYFAIVKYLEANDKEVTLALTSAGGWVESLYIAMTLIGEYDEKNVAVQRIAEQKLVVENLIAYVATLKDHGEIKAIYSDIEDLKAVFQQIKEEKVDDAATIKDGEKLIIGGGKKTTMTKENYDAIKQKVIELRTKLVMSK